MQTVSNLSKASMTRASVWVWLLCFVFCFGGTMHAQTNATGQPPQPGTQNRSGTGCTGQEPNSTAPNTTAPNTADANCQELGPNFAAPSAGVPGANRPPPLTSIIRVDAPVPKPPVAMPHGDTFNLVGSATFVKTRRETLDACLAAGKRWSARSSAGTSTTCLDYRGQVIAYQECRASVSSPDCTVVMAQGENPRTP